MVEEEKYGTLAWFQKYEPEAVEVAYPAGYAAGYAACKADVLATMRARCDRNTAAYMDIEEDLHVGKAKS